MCGWSRISNATALLFAVLGDPLWAQSVSTETLLDEMIDLRRLARLPAPAYTTRQFSSYDRLSKSPGDGTWFANNDFDEFLRIEESNGRKEYVMMEARGPGALVRIWSANPKGSLRIYLDDNATPALEAGMSVLLGGTFEPIPAPLAGCRSRGWNLYFPVPYAGNCKVTTDQGGSFYHVNYRTYAANTDVTTFATDDLSRLKDKIHAVAAKLASPEDTIPLPADCVETPLDLTLAPLAEGILLETAGPNAICDFRLCLVADELEAASRSVVITMSFDGQQTVECPLGDFFGSGPGLRPYASLPAGVTAATPPVMWCRWYMPFAKSAVVRVKNLGGGQARIKGSAAIVPWSWDDRSLHFCAGWRQQQRLPSHPAVDWPHLECTGAGRFVGGMLHVQNPMRTWWGEGDEKIYVDGESFPSHFGTGSEDYYGYAYCSPLPFTHAYHNQTRCDGPNNFGNTCVNRFHILDDIPFARSLRFHMENWVWADNGYTNRAAASYWYARPGGSSFFKPLTRADLSLEAMTLFKVPAAQEAEQLQVLEKSAGRTRKEHVNANEGWSDGAYLSWSDARPGESMTLAFHSPEGGNKKVVINVTRGAQYGIFRLEVNGRRAGEDLDLYAPRLSSSGPIELGTFPLDAGQNRLTAKIVGANEAAHKVYMFGLDYVLVK